MNIEEVRRKLIKVDAELEKITVSGDSVFRLANARLGLKDVFDEFSLAAVKPAQPETGRE